MKVALVSPDSRVEMLDEVFPASQEQLENQDFPDNSVMKANLDLMASREPRVIAVLMERQDWTE